MPVTPRISSGSSTLSWTVREDSRLKCWKTMPMRLRAWRSSWPARRAAAGEGGEVLAGDGHRAGGGALQQVDAADERGLAGAALADDAVDLALADVQVDAVQGGDLAASRR